MKELFVEKVKLDGQDILYVKNEVKKRLVLDIELMFIIKKVI